MKKEFRMESIDGIYKFKGFLNQNEKFREDFSLGLVYAPKDVRNKILLIRVNGPHGGTIDNPWHAKPHIHRTDAEGVNNGIIAERHRIFVDDYSTFEQAVQFYVKRINIIQPERSKHFPPPSPIIPTLWDGLI